MTDNLYEQIAKTEREIARLPESEQVYSLDTKALIGGFCCE